MSDDLNRLLKLADVPVNEVNVFQETEINEYDESYDFNDGDRVVLKPEYADKPGQVFTLSQWNGNRGWIGDEDDRGWYVTGDQIEQAYEPDYNDAEEGLSQIRELASHAADDVKHDGIPLEDAANGWYDPEWRETDGISLEDFTQMVQHELSKLGESVEIDEAAPNTDWEVQKAWAEVEQISRQLAAKLRKFDRAINNNIDTMDEDQKMHWSVADGIAEDITKVLQENGMG